MDNYNPPFNITTKMVNLVIEIMEKIGQLKDSRPTLRVQNESRMKSIQATLSIEGVNVSLKQVGDILSSKESDMSQHYIVAVTNTIRAYRELDNLNPYSLNDLLKIHRIMMADLISNPGNIRSSNVGVYDGKGNVIHMAPPSSIVPELIDHLFEWLKNSDDTAILIKSCVFHYEFEFIHPFLDGNGRMGRLWQTAILSNWKPIFKYIPIESVIRDNQEEYYKAIAISTKNGNSDAFIEFMLGVIDKALSDMITQTTPVSYFLTPSISKMLEVMDDKPLSTRELMQKLNLKSRVSFRKAYIVPALEAGLITMTQPDTPNSKNQLYYKVKR